MSAWREKGFVPDSEDEEDSQETFQSLERQTAEVDEAEGHEASNTTSLAIALPVETRTHPSTHTLSNDDDDDTDELSRDLPSLGALLRRTLPRSQRNNVQKGQNEVQKDDDTDASSDSLSSLPSNLSTPPLSPKLPAVRRAEEQTRSQPRPTQIQVLIEPRLATTPKIFDEVVQTSDWDHNLRAQRNFRQRKAIQLHPYILEGERYRQELKARGVRPIHVGTHTHAQGTIVRRVQYEEVDEQYESSASADNEDGAFNLSSSAPQVVTSTPPTVIDSPATHLPVIRSDSEDSLPDVRIVLNRNTISRLERDSRGIVPSKPRRGRPPKDRPVLNHISTALGDDTASVEAAVATDPPRVSRLFQSLDLPPPKKRARKSQGSPASKPQTPAVSSSTKARHRALLNESDSDAITRSRRRLQRTQTSIEMPSSHGTVVESSDHDESPLVALDPIRTYRKKIKGVLPASWLRIDQQAQHKQPERAKSRAQHRKAKTSTHRHFIAEDVPMIDVGATDLRHVQQQRASTERTINFSDGVEESDEEEFPLPHNTMGEAEEYDFVDSMAPSKSRISAAGARKRKRQLRLEDQGVQRTASKNQKTHFEDEKHRRRQGFGKSAQPSRPKTAKQTRNAPRRSILDAQVSSNGTTPEAVPHFIRLAQRQARKLPSEGRHSPTQKYVRLQTENDTADAIMTLTNWQTGKIPRRRKIPANEEPMSNRHESREPLKPRDTNHSRRRDRESVQNGSARHSLINNNLVSSIGRVKNKEPSLRQSRLSPIAMRTTSKDQRPRIHHVGDSRGKRALLNQPVYRSAQLEGLEDAHGKVKQHQSYRQQSSKTTDVFRAMQKKIPVVPLQLERFLRDTASPEVIHPNEVGLGQNAILVQRRTRRLKKQKPIRLDVETREYRQPSDPLPIWIPSEEPQRHDTEALLGLDTGDLQFSTDFDVRPLAMDTFFHKDTFVGSGDFKLSLTTQTRDFTHSAGSDPVEFGSSTFSWSNWNDLAASELTKGFHEYLLEYESLSDASGGGAVNQFHCKVERTLRSLIRFYARTLQFSDPVDRSSCMRRTVDILTETLPLFSAHDPSESRSSQTVRSTMLLCALTGLVMDMSQHTSVQRDTMSDAESLFHETARMLFGKILACGFGQLRGYLTDNRYHAERQKGISEDRPFVESLVVALQLSAKHNGSSVSTGVLLGDHFDPQLKGIQHVARLDSIWYDIFTLLPYAELDEQGLIRPGCRFQEPLELWHGVKSLLSRLFQLYSESPSGPAVNAYIRASLTRCCKLIHSWGWRCAEAVLGVIFDFLARNGLAPLPHEDYHGSPRFLDSLDRSITLDVYPEDKAFHIFLKMLGSAFQKLRVVYPQRKMTGIVFRFIPNHGRVYRKDMPVKQQDLDALRNHHDLLCVLYWASPPGCRPRLELLRNLVDHPSSHREACRLNVRAWSILVRFQLSTDEETESVVPFGLWCKELIEQTQSQYWLAKTEAESQFEAAHADGVRTISDSLLQSTITRNQRQILGTMSDIIAGMRTALKVSQSGRKFTLLLRTATLSAVFQLFDPETQRANAVIAEALLLCKEYLRSYVIMAGNASVPANDDSQDYGDFPDLDDIHESSLNESTAPNREDALFLLEPLWQLLSNCFGANKSPDDTLLSASVEAWVAGIQTSVVTNRKSWSTYIDDHNQMSWQQLRSTDQRRIYTPYFLAVVLMSDKTAYEGSSMNFLSAWLQSLVEREALLRFQHTLTSVLVGLASSEPLLDNLPFEKDKAGQYVIGLSEFRERRLTLISTVLSNMRQEFERLIYDTPVAVTVRKREYGQLLRAIMAAMKQNYCELRQGEVVTGNYTKFVHRVVELMQQFTSDIQALDPFFTDSAAFPLPVDDPTYVVGKLKSYALKTQDMKTSKQLVVFVQTLIERAAIDQQQTYLISQLYSAIDGSFESGIREKPTLRRLLMGGLFPAYIQFSLQFPCGWLLAQPVLEVCSMVFDTIIYNFTVTDKQSVESVSSMLKSHLALLCQTVELIINQGGLLEEPHVLLILSLVFDNVSSALPLLDYITRRTRYRQDPARSEIEFLHAFASFVRAMLLAQSDAPEPILIDPGVNADSTLFSDVRAFSTRELRRAMTANWSKQPHTYQYVSSNIRRQVSGKLKPYEEQKSILLDAIERFESILGVMPGARATSHCWRLPVVGGMGVELFV